MNRTQTEVLRFSHLLSATVRNCARMYSHSLLYEVKEGGVGRGLHHPKLGVRDTDIF